MNALLCSPCSPGALMTIWGGPMSWSTLPSSAWEGSSTATWDKLIRWVFNQSPLSSCCHTACLLKSALHVHAVLQMKGVFLSCGSSKPLRAWALDTAGSALISKPMTMGAKFITGNLLIAKGGNFTSGRKLPMSRMGRKNGVPFLCTQIWRRYVFISKKTHHI